MSQSLSQSSSASTTTSTKTSSATCNTPSVSLPPDRQSFRNSNEEQDEPHQLVLEGRFQFPRSDGTMSSSDDDLPPLLESDSDDDDVEPQSVILSKYDALSLEALQKRHADQLFMLDMVQNLEASLRLKLEHMQRLVTLHRESLDELNHAIMLKTN